MISRLTNHSIYEISDNAPTCLDLFCGAGGLSVGFLMAGGRPKGAVDFDEDSIKTYQRLFPCADDVVCSDISKWKPKTRRGEIDVIIGGPPCQGFSLARGLRFVDDPRNQLYKHFVQMVKNYKPKWFVMENVEGITNIGDGIILQQIIEDFTEIGYVLDYKVINMAEYGVPQMRKRAIFVGNNTGDVFKWPLASYFNPKKLEVSESLFEMPLKPFVAVNSVLGDLMLPRGNFFSHRANSQMRGPRNRDAHKEPAFTLRVRGDEFALCEKPAVSAFIPGKAPAEEIYRTPPQNDLQELLTGPRPAWAKDEGLKLKKAGSHSVVKGTRRLTIREQARLQTFPDWVVFSGRETSQAKQIGNAVPPLFACQLFQQIFEHLGSPKHICNKRVRASR